MSLIDKLHKQKDTPEYTDHCGHGESTYVGSIQRLNHEHEKEWLDIYVFEDSVQGTSVCIRYGAEQSKYISPGSIKHVIAAGIQRRGDEYELALHVIEKHGKITFIRS